eukprot:Hpha_TRINITY_DN4540_c0_g1::TRINITY_DN4540_c0_g1_i1::g.115509::m.115509
MKFTSILDEAPKPDLRACVGPAGYRVVKRPGAEEQTAPGEITLAIPPRPPRPQLAVELEQVAKSSAMPIPSEVAAVLKEERKGEGDEEVKKKTKEDFEAMLEKRPGRSRAEKWGPAHVFGLFGLIMGISFTVLAARIGWASCIAFAVGGWSLFCCSGVILFGRTYQNLAADAEWLRRTYEAERAMKL